MTNYIQNDDQIQLLIDNGTAYSSNLMSVTNKYEPNYNKDFIGPYEIIIGEGIPTTFKIKKVNTSVSNNNNNICYGDIVQLISHIDGKDYWLAFISRYGGHSNTVALVPLSYTKAKIIERNWIIGQDPILDQKSNNDQINNYSIITLTVPDDIQRPKVTEACRRNECRINAQKDMLLSLSYNNDINCRLIIRNPNINKPKQIIPIDVNNNNTLLNQKNNQSITQLFWIIFMILVVIFILVLTYKYVSNYTTPK